tara:strand:- start:22 stop:624 length:603 start_codon:yes stop_codon:yes gene_type:complete
MALTKLNNKAVANVSTLPVALGDMVFISSQTASDSASISFTTGIDSTYKEYQFWFIDVHARTDSTGFFFNMSTDSGSNYNVTKTTTAFIAFHNESDVTTGLLYSSNDDLAQSTALQPLSQASNMSSDADHNLVGSLSLFNPASTTYVKHFISNNSYNHPADFQQNFFIAGYGNTTSAINAVQFKMGSGNFDGTILMYGIN